MASSGSANGAGAGAGAGSGSGSSSPCGACKFLRRKCASGCVFAPYFSSEQGAARFAAIHKVFGASNVSKLLLHIPAHDRCEAVVTIAYEAQARIRDPVYGCVAHIFALQQQVACLQAQLMQAKAQVAQNAMNVHNIESEWHGNLCAGMPYFMPTYNQSCSYVNSISPQSSLESVEFSKELGNSMNSMHEIRSREEFCLHNNYLKKRPYNNDWSELQALAIKMMRN